MPPFDFNRYAKVLHDVGSLPVALEGRILFPNNLSPNEESEVKTSKKRSDDIVLAKKYLAAIDALKELDRTGPHLLPCLKQWA